MSMFDTITNEDIIKGTEDFALVHIKYNGNTDLCRELSKIYHIKPIMKKYENGGFCVYSGSCCMNDDNPSVSKEEMLMKFNLLYGKEVKYELEYECDHAYSDMRISYRGKLRK